MFSSTRRCLVHKRLALFLAVLFGALVCIVGVGAGGAQAEGETVFGFLFQRKGTERINYPGVVVTAKGPAGFSGKATSDAKGRWDIPVPKAGSYTVAIDTKTLPK